MESLTRRKRFNIISLITIIVITLVFGYYYFFYVKYKENRFHEKAFRMMEQVEQNISDKFTNDLKVIQNSVEQARYETKDSVKFISKFYEYFDTIDFPAEFKLKKYSTSADKLTITSNFKMDTIEVNLKSGSFNTSLTFKFERLLTHTMQYDFFKKYIVLNNITTDKGKIIYSDIPITPKVLLSYDSLIQKSNIRYSSIISSTYYNGKPHIVYLMPININPSINLYIGGLIEKEYFTKETFRINPIALAAIFFILVLLILSLPILKLKLLSDCERLSTMDVILSFLAKIAGSAFLSLMIIYLFSKFGPDYENRLQLLKTYSTEIEKEIVAEIKENLRMMNEKTSELKKMDENKQKNFYYYDKTDRDFDFDFLTWINSDGYHLVRWQNGKITPRANVSERHYFKNILNNQFWKDKTISKTGFYFGSIVSWTTGKHNAILSRKVDCTFPLTKLSIDSSFKSELTLSQNSSHFFEPVVMTMGTDLECLKKLYLPSQISYMIIDQKGDVLFHKDKNKELQENLIKETDNDFNLKSTLHAQAENTFIQAYNSKKRMFHVNPIGTLPLYIVTFLDYDYEYIVDVQILSLSSLLFFTLLLSVTLILVIYLLIDYKRSHKIQGRELFFNWFWPSRQKVNVYLKLTLAMSVVALLYLVLGIYRNIYSTYLLFSLIFTLNILYLKNYQSWEELKENPKDVVFFGIALGLVTLINFIIPNASLIQVIGVFGCIAVFMGFMNYSSGLVRKTKFIKVKNHNIFYNIYVFTLVVFIGVMPVYSFYKNAWEYEKELYVKNLQLSLAHNYQQRMGNQKDTTMKVSFTNFTKGNHFYSNASDEPTNGLISRLRFSLDTATVTSDLLNHNSDNNNGLSGQFSTLDTTIIYSNVTGLKIESIRPLFSVRSLIERQFEQKGIVLILLVTMLILLILIYNLIVFWSRKVFLLNLIPYQHRDLNKIMESHNNCIVITPAFSKGLTFLMEKIMEDGSIGEAERNLPLIDLSRAGDYSFVQNEVKRIDEQKFPKVLIADFESNSKKNIETKIRLIARLKEIARINNYQQQIIILTPHMITNINSEDYNLEESIISRYLEATNEFIKTYLSLRELSLPEISLNKLFDHEDAILYKQDKIQVLYHSIWQNCTRREQYLIYDIAQDGLLNPKNLPIIYNLLKKGVFIPDDDGRLVLFSNSFRNFVLTIINREQALQIENESKIRGLWSNMKLPIILIILALFILVFITNQGAFNNMIGWLTAAFGSIAVLSRVLSGFSLLNIFKGSGK